MKKIIRAIAFKVFISTFEQNKSYFGNVDYDLLLSCDIALRLAREYLQNTNQKISKDDLIKLITVALDKVDARAK